MPQAAAWSDGDAYVTARRASLEDDLDALERVAGIDLNEVIESATLSEAKAVIGRIAALATGRLALMKEARELDDRLGLTPKSMAALRWTIVGDTERQQATGTSAARYGHLSKVK